MLQFRRLGENDYEFRIRGDRFLYKMVRNIVGTLVQVGCGELDQNELVTALSEGSFSTKPTTAPAHGLFLHTVMFDSDLFPQIVGASSGLKPWRGGVKF